MSAIRILLIEDSRADAQITTHAFASTQVTTDMHVISDGAVALSWLTGPDDETTPRPDLILLDLNLPTISGHAVLGALKADPALRQIPVVVLSTSDAPEDIAAAYAGHANSYVTKPDSLTEYYEMARAIDAFWLQTAMLPSEVY